MSSSLAAGRGTPGPGALDGRPGPAWGLRLEYHGGFLLGLTLWPGLTWSSPRGCRTGPARQDLACRTATPLALRSSRKTRPPNSTLKASLHRKRRPVAVAVSLLVFTLLTVVMEGWYWLDGAQQHQGPFSLPQLSERAKSGLLPPATFVWREGLPAWEPLSQVGLQDLLRAFTRA